MFKIISFLLCISVQAWGQVSPKSTTHDNNKIGINLGVESGMTITEFDGEPVGLSSSDMTPPMLTFKFEYRPDYSSLFQPDGRFNLSILRGGGQYFQSEVGGWFDFPQFHLFFGFELLTTFSGGDYDETIVDHWGMGGYVKAGIPLGILYPAIELRTRTIQTSEVANHEGLTTYVKHDGDTILRPSLTVDLTILKLWGALTYYDIGKTAIASDDFAIGIDSTSVQILSAGVGFNLGSAELWVKGHKISGVEDEVAHFYQVPLMFPDFMLAKESAFVEVLWKF